MGYRNDWECALHARILSYTQTPKEIHTNSQTPTQTPIQTPTAPYLRKPIAVKQYVGLCCNSLKSEVWQSAIVLSGSLDLKNGTAFLLQSVNAHHSVAKFKSKLKTHLFILHYD